MLNVFVSGLERQSGKTIFAAGLAATMQSLCYSTSYYKPIQTGANALNGIVLSQDTALVNLFDSNIKTGFSYAFPSILSPLVGAYEVNSKVDISKIYNDYQSNIQMTDCHIIEGSNSISAPITEKETEIDLIKTLGLPMLLILNPKRSAIDDVILGINYISTNKVNLLGVIINEFDENSSNLEEKYFPQIIKEYTNVNILGTLPNYGNISNITPDTLIADILNKVNIEEVFGLKIAKLNS